MLLYMYNIGIYYLEYNIQYILIYIIVISDRKNIYIYTYIRIYISVSDS